MRKMAIARWISAAFLLVGLFATYAPDEQASAQARGWDKNDSAMLRTWQEALAGFQSGRYDNAISDCEEIINSRAAGGLAERASFLLADCYFEIHKPTLDADFLAVLDAYQRAIQKYPRSAEVPKAYLQLGLIHQEADYSYEASAYFNIVIKSYGNSPYVAQAHLCLGKLHLARNETAKARQEFETVLSAFPQSKAGEETYLGLAGLSIQEGRYEQAAGYLENLQAMRPDVYRSWPIFLFYRGQVRMAAAHYADARTDFLSYANLTPRHEKDHLAAYAAAEAYEKEGRMAEALRLYRYVSQVYPQSEGAACARYRLVERIERPGRVIRAGSPLDSEPYLSVLEKSSGTPVAEEAMARLIVRYYETGKAAESIDWLTRFVATYPRSEYTAQVTSAGAGAFLQRARDLSSRKAFKDIVQLYEENKRLVEQIRNGAFFHCLASAFRDLFLYDHAAYFYYRANEIGVEGEDGLRLLAALEAAKTAAPETQAALKSAGVPFREGIRQARPGLRIAFVWAPDNVLIELMETKTT